MKAENYKILLFNNNTYMYNMNTKCSIVIENNKYSIKDEKIFNLSSFLEDLKKNNLFKRVMNKLIGSKLTIITWPTYTDVDKKIFIDVFTELNFVNIDFKDITDLINVELPKIVISKDGIYLFSEIFQYFPYNSINKNHQSIIIKIKKQYKMKNYILIGDVKKELLLDENALIFENNDNYFKFLLKNID